MASHVVLRVLILAVAVPGLVLCVDRVERNHPAVVLYKNASLCPVGTPWETADDCIARTTGEVVDMDWSESCTTNSNGGTSCTRSYSMDVRFGERTESLGVGSNTFRATDRGDPAELRLWRGEVVRMVAGGHVEGYLTSSEWAFWGWLFLGWLLLGASWLALFGLWLYPLLGGWLLLTVPYLMVAYNLLGLNPMGVVGWSITGLITGVGVWFMGRSLAAVVV
ncbi:hypothetical protein [Streptomyces aurantiogriseus]|uniref:hypothetical protein n=1 Tax=Streptomyces aurantiogriseus TaxID=66870 RepID=UPI001679A105|nr:hypothetical protein [Streptomyces aurantiogriseus]